MPNVIAYNIFDEEGCQKNADDGIYKEEPVGMRNVEMGSQQIFYRMDKPFERLCGKSCAYTYDKTKNQNRLFVAEMLFAPLRNPFHNPVFYTGGSFHTSLLFTDDFN